MSSEGIKVRNDLEQKVITRSPIEAGNSVQEMEEDGFFLFCQWEAENMPGSEKIKSCWGGKSSEEF